MNIKILPAPLKGTVAAIASKSDAHRLLLCAAFADRETEITLSSTSRDIEATASCLAALGAKIERTEKGLLVTPVKKAVQNPVLNCGESGSTLRFLLPAAAAVSETPELRGGGRLPQRPVGDLLDALACRGKTVVSREFPLRLSGMLTPGVFEVPGSVSSQFVSGLLMAAPLTKGDCDIRLTSPLSSGEYVSMTVSAMRKFGAKVTETDAGYYVAARPYRSPGRIDAEGDWSNAAFWLTAAALGGEVTVTGLPADSLQPDRRLLAILQDYGADIETNGDAVTCRAALRRPFDLETDGAPDLAPVLCVLAAGANGTSRIRDISRLSGKESDRVASCAALVQSLGGALEVRDNSFLIHGKPRLSGGTVDAMGDHRIVMAAAAASVLCGGDVTVLGAQAADKSYPGFFADFKMLGGQTTNAERKNDMTDISKTREQIDGIDEQLVALLTERMACSREIAAYKKENGLPVSDEHREREVLSRVSELARPEEAGYVQSVYETIFSVSRACQSEYLYDDAPLRKRIETARETTAPVFPPYAVVACQGIEGAYSQLAADRMFRSPSVMYFGRFEGVFSAVSGGLCRYGVLPIENSTAGSVNEVYDLMRKNKFYIVRSIKYKVRHCLLAKPGVQLSEITEVYSHEQALSQCSAFLSKLPNIKITACENTAVAARLASQSENRGVAALSSPECAELYGLSIVVDNVMNSGSNYTRFICISQNLEIYPGSDKISLMMSLPHKPGSLSRVISKFSALGLNLTKLESRPIAGRDFEFTFYFDVRADVSASDVTALLCEFEKEIDDFSYLGSYIEEA